MENCLFIDDLPIKNPDSFPRNLRLLMVNYCTTVSTKPPWNLHEIPMLVAKRLQSPRPFGSPPSHRGCALSVLSAKGHNCCGCWATTWFKNIQKLGLSAEEVCLFLQFHTISTHFQIVFSELEICCTMGNYFWQQICATLNFRSPLCLELSLLQPFLAVDETGWIHPWKMSQIRNSHLIQTDFHHPVTSCNRP